MARTFCFFLVLTETSQSQNTVQVSIVISEPGILYEPADSSIQLIGIDVCPTWQQCASNCQRNPFCHVFNYDATNQAECRLFEGDSTVVGRFAPSSLSTSRLGIVQLNPSLFKEYGQPCSIYCHESRYLTCGPGNVCHCLSHHYWNSYFRICQPKLSVWGVPCAPEFNMCREDLNLVCSSSYHECRYPEKALPLVGVSLGNGTSIINGTASVGFNTPVGISISSRGNHDLLVVADLNKKHITRLENADSSQISVSLIFSTGPGNTNLNQPTHAFFDEIHKKLYVVDKGDESVIVYHSIQNPEAARNIVAGIVGSPGSTLNKLRGPSKAVVDSYENIYITDTQNHRIMMWRPNATFGTIVAGTGSADSTSYGLRTPIGLYLDESNSELYVADSDNHRIQLFQLVGTPPYNGTTVAGGNGAGSATNQLNKPNDIWISKYTKSIYIVDTNNNRIQRWNRGAVNGVTVAGDSSGAVGSTNMHLNTPRGLMINQKETRIYVTDTGNRRIQRFDME